MRPVVSLGPPELTGVIAVGAPGPTRAEWGCGADFLMVGRDLAQAGAGADEVRCQLAWALEG
ncbi:MAG: hypothetical protein AB7S38_12975 [Vulcanimicrobiota bacterium]